MKKTSYCPSRLSASLSIWRLLCSLEIAVDAITPVKALRSPAPITPQLIKMTKQTLRNQFHSLAFLATFLAAATGCGGGGSSGGSAPAPIPSPAPTPPPVQAASLQAAAPATYAPSDESSTVFSAMNTFRTSMGLGPLQQNANIDLAAKNHSAYVLTNTSGADPHAEVVGSPGFTGVSVSNRLVAAGYAATSSTEVIAFNTTWPITTNNVIDVLSDTVYHRAGMMTQGFTHMGIADSTADSPTYIDMGSIKAQANAGDYVGVYPYSGQTGLTLTHYMESPNPFYLEMPMTSDNMCTKTSYPISLASEASTVLAVTSFTVTEEGQSTPLDVRLITKATSAQDSAYLPSNVAFIVGKVPFKKNTKYNVHFVGKATGTATGTSAGMAIDKVWSFTTGTDLRNCG
jgi:uncharacterized protein YkwD